MRPTNVEALLANRKANWALQKEEFEQARDAMCNVMSFQRSQDMARD